ncbi:hypothetical protein [Aminipila luticellarii]|uniref:Uncharacterized protein n=1 Tax=Aminipila luticellarii TaxID=2507160 RepID=A0A410PSF7_9FIRM|nr:hypothetical protein [Aminipila luticellarii]QAT41854.1 hypothetical protein EQM06_00675 [Aminipila luticellarii]
MEYSKYNKAMVLLSEENRDFAAKSDQAIYGNLRIETGNSKGAISLSVQNLRFFERNRYIYKLILFGEKKERTIHAVMGSLILNRFGTGENYFRFDPGNVDGRGGQLSDYSVAIVAAVSMRDNKEPLHPVLKGKLAFSGSNVIAATAEKLNNKEETEEQETKEERNLFDEALETNPYDVQDFAKKQRTTYNYFYNQYVKDLCEKTAKAAELYDLILPFSRDRTGAKWKRIANIKNLPLVSPGAMWGASKYRHYIFGEDQKLYYVGIPGRFLNEEQPEGGKSGFVLWQPIVGAENLEATKAECSLENRMIAYGYWITAIDRETGDIIDPMQK